MEMLLVVLVFGHKLKRGVKGKFRSDIDSSCRDHECMKPTKCIGNASNSC